MQPAPSAANGAVAAPGGGKDAEPPPTDAISDAAVVMDASGSDFYLVWDDVSMF